MDGRIPPQPVAKDGLGGLHNGEQANGGVRERSLGLRGYGALSGTDRVRLAP